MTRIAALLCAALIFSACADGTAPSEDGTMTVVAALYPAAFLAEEIGGERTQVMDLTPAGAEPHDLEMTAGQVREIAEADLLVYAGEGFQPAVQDAASDLPIEARFDILGGSASPLPAAEDDHHEEDEHADEHEDEHGGESTVDPHIWLDPARLALIAEDLTDRLIAIDPDGAETYRDNAAALVAELADLDARFERGLKDCERREIVVSHSAFGYLASRYDLEEVAFAGLDPEAEPSPARLAEVTEFAREHGVTTVFYEELTSPAAAETLAGELGLETSVLSPLESRPEQGDYVGAMTTNLDNLRAALDCA